MGTRIRDFEAKYRTVEPNKTIIHCPDHGRQAMYGRFNKEKRAVGMGCEICYKNLPVYVKETKTKN